jgi:TPP-dependent trihydroxycyclohexane-1,2-dione (THcHDO) dehydratase
MPGAPDIEYVAARRALLDALEALAEHRTSIVVVGAQAVYVHTGAADLSVAEFTEVPMACSE